MDVGVRDRFFIGGRWVEPAGSGTIEVANPTTEVMLWARGVLVPKPLPPGRQRTALVGVFRWFGLPLMLRAWKLPIIGSR